MNSRHVLLPLSATAVLLLASGPALAALPTLTAGWRAAVAGEEGQRPLRLALAAPTATAPSAAPTPLPAPAPSVAVPAQATSPTRPTPAPSAKAVPAVQVATSPIQTLPAPVLLPPTARAVANDGRFDLSVNNAPAAQVFMQLGQGTAFNMLVSPEVSGNVTLALKDTTVTEALEALRELYGYDFRISGNRVFVLPNTVQTRLYRVNYLPGRRQGASDTRVTSSALSLSGAGSNGNSNSSNNSGNAGSSNNGGGNNGGNSQRQDDSAHVRTTSDADFWREVQSSLGMMVGAKEGRSVVLNIAAGVIVVRATPAELRQVEGYLKAVQVSIDRQVMLEAKIVEVQLSKDAQTGINWSGFGRVLGTGSGAIGMAAPGATLPTTGSMGSGDGNTVSPGAALLTGTLGRGFYGLAFQSANFAALLNFLQTQGNVQVLSSPRIATLNNQKAVLKVGSDELYVTGITTSTTSSGTNTVSTPSLTLQPFFSGISLDVTPQIDENGMVMLHVHPAVSTVSEKTKNVDLGALGAYKLPLAASTVNETDSIVRVRDGQIVAIGGLMKQEMRDEKTGLPLAQDMPVVGGLFRQTSTVVSKRELVILLKPTVIHEDGNWPAADVPAVSLAAPK
ncbi:MSHA-type pilus biogenesis protein MshL [Burkholderiales bacterium JOSHI_001]|nr:MSHA-type pilus biogenesis protein MshL [Burkholderiales bacterium JOSHI_001]